MSHNKTSISIVLIGAGNRGRGIFGQYALDFPHRAKFVAVVEPDADRRAAFSVAHGIPEDRQFSSVAEFFAKHPRKIADGLIIATQENVRAEAIELALEAGYAVLCEKPLGLTALDVIAVTDTAKKHDGLFMVCHQMRYAPLYCTLKRLVDSGEYGKVVNIEHSENLDFEHMAHSYVRGYFNNDALTPMILAKSCHDMDLLLYLTAAKPLRISSFGSLSHFRSENAPEGAPKYCLDGCPAAATCPYDVQRAYFRPNTDPAYLRQMGVIKDRLHLMELLKTNRFGRCVYHCDNNVVDHQVCSIEFEGGVTASFTMTGHNAIERRRTRIQLTDGEIELDSFKKTIEIRKFSTGDSEVLTPPLGGTHSGGDVAIMQNFVETILSGNQRQVLTSVSESLDSHLLAFAAEFSRKTNQCLAISDFEEGLRQLQHVE
jgi:predicted dehydrogenase